LKPFIRHTSKKSFFREMFSGTAPHASATALGPRLGSIHARGPVSLDGLVIYKYKLIGNGHLVGDYADRSRSFKHDQLNKDFGLQS